MIFEVTGSLGTLLMPKVFSNKPVFFSGNQMLCTEGKKPDVEKNHHALVERASPSQETRRLAAQMEEDGNKACIGESRRNGWAQKVRWIQLDTHTSNFHLPFVEHNMQPTKTEVLVRTLLWNLNIRTVFEDRHEGYLKQRLDAQAMAGNADVSIPVDVQHTSSCEASNCGWNGRTVLQPKIKGIDLCNKFGRSSTSPWKCFDEL